MTPQGQSLETVRRIRDELDAKVQALVDELTPEIDASSN